MPWEQGKSFSRGEYSSTSSCSFFFILVLLLFMLWSLTYTLIPMCRASLVDDALESGSMYMGEGWNYAKESWASGGTLHFFGLLSDGGVHSRYDQLAALMHGAFDHGCKRIRVHILTDGRDVPDGSSVKYVGQLEKDLENLRSHGCDALIASGGGRMCVTMDRYEVHNAACLVNCSNSHQICLSYCVLLKC
jgi:bisphosphoglycerate-independent phosphoglycerate mutase (AlkP superfamily)